MAADRLGWKAWLRQFEYLPRQQRDHALADPQEERTKAAVSELVRKAGMTTTVVSAYRDKHLIQL